MDLLKQELKGKEKAWEQESARMKDAVQQMKYGLWMNNYELEKVEKGKGVLQEDFKGLKEENRRLRSKLRYERLPDALLKVINTNRVKNYWKRKAEEGMSEITELTGQLRDGKKAYELCEEQKDDWRTKYLAAATDTAKLKEENDALRAKLGRLQEMDRELTRLRTQITHLTNEEARYRSWFEATMEIS